MTWAPTGMTCDREAGHAGPHRGYDVQIDEALFWNDLEVLSRLRHVGAGRYVIVERK